MANPVPLSGCTRRNDISILSMINMARYFCLTMLGIILVVLFFMVSRSAVV